MSNLNGIARSAAGFAFVGALNGSAGLLLANVDPALVLRLAAIYKNPLTPSKDRVELLELRVTCRLAMAPQPSVTQKAARRRSHGDGTVTLARVPIGGNSNSG